MYNPNRRQSIKSNSRESKLVDYHSPLTWIKRFYVNLNGGYVFHLPCGRNNKNRFQEPFTYNKDIKCYTNNTSATNTVML